MQPGQIYGSTRTSVNRIPNTIFSQGRTITSTIIEKNVWKFVSVKLACADCS
jgi:hypothetical protein